MLTQIPSSPLFLEPRTEAALSSLQSRARYCFTAEEFARLTERQRSRSAAAGALQRLAKRGRIVPVLRRPAVYLIVPPEHASFGAPPFAWWIDDCMRWIEPNYYVALLSAAAHWGSAHYARQDVQVVVSRPRAPITAGRLTLTFVTKRSAAATPTETVSRGVAPWRVSTPAATVLDVVRYQDSVGGLEAVVRVLVDLAPAITPTGLRAALEALGERSSAQRLGFLLDRAGQERLAQVVATWLGRRAHRVPQPLEIGIADRKMPEVDRRWHVAFDPARLALALEAL